MIFNKQILPSGLRLITIPMADNPSVTVLVMVAAGSKYETREENGISHFLEHMVFKGTPKRPKAIDISRELDALGAHYNAFTGQEYTGYYAKADARHLPQILDIVSDMYLNPLLDEQEMAKEKGVIVEEIRMYRDLPHQHVQDLFMELLHGDQPAGWNVAGTEANVRAFTREAVSAYRSANYVPEATVVLVAGSIDEQTISAKVERAFTGLAAGAKRVKPSVIESQDGPRILVEPKDTDQTHLVLGMRTFPVGDARIPVMRVLSAILGRGMSSRLWSRMRDELGICYYVRALHEAFTDHGALTISAGVDNSRVAEAIREILAVCARLRDEEVPEAELRKAKDNIAGTTMLDLETSDSRAEYAAYHEILEGEIESPADAIAKVNAVTAAEVRDLARLIFTEKALNLALVGRSDEASLMPLLRFA